MTMARPRQFLAAAEPCDKSRVERCRREREASDGRMTDGRDGTRPGREALHLDRAPGLGPVGIDTFCIELLARLPPQERWTHFWDDEDAYRQHDHLLVSPHVSQKSAAAVPQIVRLGLPYRALRHQGPRAPRVGYDRPKASDHCPVVCEVTF